MRVNKILPVIRAAFSRAAARRTPPVGADEAGSAAPDFGRLAPRLEVASYVALDLCMAGRPYAPPGRVVYHALREPSQKGDRVEVRPQGLHPVTVELTRSRCVPLRLSADYDRHRGAIEKRLSEAFGILCDEMMNDAASKLTSRPALLVTAPVKLPASANYPGSRVHLFWPNPEVSFSLSILTMPSLHEYRASVESCWGVREGVDEDRFVPGTGTIHRPWTEAWPEAERLPNRPLEGDRVEVILNGDDEPYLGTCIRERKMWVDLENYPGGKFIACENSISRFRVVKRVATDEGPGR